LANTAITQPNEHVRELSPKDDRKLTGYADTIPIDWLGSLDVRARAVCRGEIMVSVKNISVFVELLRSSKPIVHGYGKGWKGGNP